MTPLEVAQAMFARIDAGDFAGLPDLAAEDFVIHEPPNLPYGGDWHGRDALPRLFGHVMGYWDDPVIERMGVTADDSRFYVQLIFNVTSKISGKRLTQSIAEITRCSDGKMAETWVHYFDPVEVEREAGPPRPRNRPLES